MKQTKCSPFTFTKDNDEGDWNKTIDLHIMLKAVVIVLTERCPVTCPILYYDVLLRIWQIHENKINEVYRRKVMMIFTWNLMTYHFNPFEILAVTSRTGNCQPLSKTTTISLWQATKEQLSTIFSFLWSYLSLIFESGIMSLQGSSHFFFWGGGISEGRA